MEPGGEERVVVRGHVVDTGEGMEEVELTDVGSRGRGTRNPLHHRRLENADLDAGENGAVDESQEHLETRHGVGTYDKSLVHRWRRQAKAYIRSQLFDDSVIPVECQIWRRQNIAVPLSYCIVGMIQGLTTGVMTVYPLELGATEAQQLIIKNLRDVPAAFKLVYGFISDAYPVFGYRRKVYMGAGWSVCSFAMTLLALTPKPSVPFLALMVFVFGIAFWFADVMADALVAEKAKLEPEAIRGQLQSTCYACRFFWLVAGVLISTFMYEILGAHTIFASIALLPALVLLLPCLWLREERYVDILPVKEQIQQVWETVCSRAVWQPMAFVYIYHLLQLTNAAWNQFLYTYLEFSTFEMNLILVFGEVLLFVGVVFYKWKMMRWSWRATYIIGISMNAVFSAAQLVLIYRLNKGVVPDVLLAVGDEAVLEFITGMEFLPLTIMMVHLCPDGGEGVSYAMFTTVNNAGINLSYSISTSMLSIWDASKEAMEDGRLGGLAKLTILTTAIQLSAGFFLPLLPKYKDDLMRLSHEAKSSTGGAVLLAILVFSLAWTLISMVLDIVAPGWADESR